MKTEVFNKLLSKLGIHPVLVDVGASGAPPRIWDEIARQSVYVGFDPDLREIREVPDDRFYKAIIVNEAITDDKGSDEVLFHFTKSPFCSSTLKPDAKSLSGFLFSDFFAVEKEGRVRATTLDSVMERLSLSRIDWLKVDSQGTDLRIFNSLRDEVRSRVLAVDMEPGLIDAYVGEDLFVDVHRDLTQNGFWLSNLDVHGTVRVRKATVDEAMASDKDTACNLVEGTVKKSPGWVNARYFRTIEWLIENDFTKHEYVLLWGFALLDKQLGFALDLAVEYEKIFGEDEISQLMKDVPVLRMRRTWNRMLFRRAKSFIPAGVRRRLRKFIR